MSNSAAAETIWRQSGDDTLDPNLRRCVQETDDERGEVSAKPRTVRDTKRPLLCYLRQPLKMSLVAGTGRRSEEARVPAPSDTCVYQVMFDDSVEIPTLSRTKSS